MVKRISLGLLLTVAGIQFIRPGKNLSPVPAKTDLFVLHPAPAEVKRLLMTGCYDCHSENTRYPWYAEIQPAAWWLAQHINDGKRELNLSFFGELSARRQATKLDDMADVITTRKMPLSSYTLVHRDAKFTNTQIKQLTAWLDALRDRLAPDG